MNLCGTADMYDVQRTKNIICQMDTVTVLRA